VIERKPEPVRRQELDRRLIFLFLGPMISVAGALLSVSWLVVFSPAANADKIMQKVKRPLG
jgi:hypothetical protein